MKMAQPYAPHAAFIAPARHRNALKYLLFGYFAIEFLYRVTYDLLDAFIREFAPAAMDAFYIGASPLSLAAQLFSFAFLAVSTMLVVRFVHHRNPLTLIGSLKTCRQQFLASFWPLLFLLFVFEFIPPYWSSQALDRSPDFMGWALFLPVSLAAVMVQIGAEEMLYRGYLQQQLATLFRHPSAWLIPTNLVFGIAHWSDGAPLEANVQYVIWAFCLGLCASDLTARSGTLGPALAIHFANNLFAFLLYGETGGHSSGFALFIFPPDSLGGAFEDGSAQSFVTWQLVLELLALWMMWMAARIGLRR